MNNDQIYNACDMLHRHGITFSTFNMVGLPDETIENVLETITLNSKCRPSYAWCSILQPYPGTELYNFVASKKLIFGNCEIKSDYHTSSPIESSHKKELRNLHDLFSILVRFPFLIALAKRIIKYPPNAIFRTIHLLHKGCAYLKDGVFRINKASLAILLRSNGKIFPPKKHPYDKIAPQK